MENLQSPEHFFLTQVSKRGRSTADGVYLNGLTVILDPNVIYGPSDSNSVDIYSPPASIDPLEWKDLLIDLRVTRRDGVITTSSTTGQVYMFHINGPSLDLVNFVPFVSLRSLHAIIARAQDALKAAAGFSGKLEGTLKLMIGQAFADWDDLVGEGEAELEERDLSY